MEERRRVMSTLDGLHRGLDYEECVRVLIQNRWQPVQIDLSPSEISLKTLFEIGAQNWQVLLIFEDNRLTKIQVGTVDNLNLRPHDYPLKDWPVRRDAGPSEVVSLEHS